MKRLLLTMLCLGFLASGCTIFQIDSKDTTLDFYPPKTNIDQVAYLEKTDKAYVEIGIVSVTTERCQSLQEVLPKLKQEAGMLGADAVMDVHNDATDFWKRIAPQKILANAYIRTTYTARAIVWK